MALSLSGDGTLSGVDIAASGLGKVLQIVRATDATQRNTTSTSFVDASISVTITPTKSTSAILLVWSVQIRTDTGNQLVFFQITDSSNNAINGSEEGRVYDTNTGSIRISTVLFGYSTPATTSATTYKGRFKVSSGTGYLDNDLQTGQLYAIEVAA